MKCLLIFLGIAILGVGTTYGQSYFDLRSKSYLIPRESEVEISVLYDLRGYKSSEFLIRPITSEGTVFIFDNETENWVPGTDLWLKMPELSDKLKLKIFSGKDTDINLVIFNKTTQEIYSSPVRKYYPYSNFMRHMVNLKLKYSTVGD